jgi:hypothetical protein
VILQHVSKSRVRTFEIVEFSSTSLLGEDSQCEWIADARIGASQMGVRCDGLLYAECEDGGGFHSSAPTECSGVARVNTEFTCPRGDRLKHRRDRRVLGSVRGAVFIFRIN